jgi:hypothetical protein
MSCEIADDRTLTDPTGFKTMWLVGGTIAESESQGRPLPFCRFQEVQGSSRVGVGPSGTQAVAGQGTRSEYEQRCEC